MIFTRRFGALAARPNFRKADEAAQEPDVASPEAELEAITAEVESDSAYAGSK